MYIKYALILILSTISFITQASKSTDSETLKQISRSNMQDIELSKNGELFSTYDSQHWRTRGVTYRVNANTSSSSLAQINNLLPLTAEQHNHNSKNQQTMSGETPDGLSKPEWQSIQAQINSSKYKAYPTDQGAYKSANPTNGWQIDYGIDGTTTLSPYDKNADENYHISLRLNSVSYQSLNSESSNTFVQPTSISFNNDRLNYYWNDNITEYWVNSEQKLEQWFEIKQRPQGRQKIGGQGAQHHLLQVQMTLDTDLQVSLKDNRLRLGDITYNQLKVWDANGQIIAAHLDLQGKHLNLLLEDQHATYPLTIDPSFTQQAYLKASNPGASDNFGFSVSIFLDTLVVGAPREGAGSAGAVYVFVQSGTTWTQQAYLKASTPGVGDSFGTSVSIFSDTLVVGASGEASNTTGVNGDEVDNSAADSGAAYVFVRNFGVWTQQAYLKASNTDAGDGFGTSVSYYNETLVIGADKEASNATGINGNQGNNTFTDSGAAYVFVRDGSSWTQQAYLKASNTDTLDAFGRSVEISVDTLVVGAPGEDSRATGINGVQGSNLLSGSGAAYVFVRNGSTWSQQAYLKASNTGFGDAFGRSLTILNDTLVVGATGEASNAIGIDGDQSDNSATGSGAAYVFTRNGTTWSQQAYLKASNTDPDDRFGTSISISRETIVVGASGEDSNTIGLDGDQSDNSAANSGAAYVFSRNGATWSQQGYLKASNTDASDRYGRAVTISAGRLVVGASGEASNATGVNGNQSNNSAAFSGAAYMINLTYTVGGTVTGLAAGNDVTLQNNGGDDFIVNANGIFTFPTALTFNSGYEVTILNQPTTPNQVCTLSNESGSLYFTDIHDVTVSCNAEPTARLDFYDSIEDIVFKALDADGTNTNDPNDNGVLANDSDTEFDNLFVTTTGSFTAGGIGGLITMNEDGTFIYEPPADAFGSAFFDYTVSDGQLTVDTQLVIDVLSVNDAPSFTLAGDVELGLLDLITNPIEINGFITGFDLGPANESMQVIDTYEVVIQSDSDTIVNAVSVENTGVLVVDFTTNIGVALIDVVLQDDGGDTFGGVDRSPVQSFFIAFTGDSIFIDGFESTDNSLVLKHLIQIQVATVSLDFPVHDVAADGIKFYGEWFYLNSDYSQLKKLEIFEHWLKEVLIYKAPFVDYDNDGIENYLDQQPFIVSVR